MALLFLLGGGGGGEKGEERMDAGRAVVHGYSSTEVLDTE